MLDKDFAASRGKEIPIYFTDVTELGEPEGALTEEAIYKMMTLAEIKPDFDCRGTVAVVCQDWEQRKGDIIGRYEDYVSRLTGTDQH